MMNDKVAYEVLAQAWKLIKKYQTVTEENSGALVTELIELSEIGKKSNDALYRFSMDVATATCNYFQNKNELAPDTLAS